MYDKNAVASSSSAYAEPDVIGTIPRYKLLAESPDSRIDEDVVKARRAVLSFELIQVQKTPGSLKPKPLIVIDIRFFYPQK